MVQVVNPSTIIERLTIEKVPGELTINLNLNITVRQDGTVQVVPAVKGVKEHVQDDPTLFAIPDFTQEAVLPNFGD